jgi:hypothetical protein
MENLVSIEKEGRTIFQENRGMKGHMPLSERMVKSRHDKVYGNWA